MSHKKVKSGDIVKVYDDLVSVESGMDVNDVTLVAPIFRSVYSKSNIEHRTPQILFARDSSVRKVSWCRSC